MSGAERFEISRRALLSGEGMLEGPRRVVDQAAASGSLYRLRSRDVRRIDYWVSVGGLLLLPYVRDDTAVVEATVSDPAPGVLAWADLVAVIEPTPRPAVHLPSIESANDLIRWFAEGDAASATGVLLLVEDEQGVAGFARIDDAAGSHVVLDARGAGEATEPDDGLTIMGALLRPVVHLRVELAATQ